jgi:DtxR family Mn-dependent transcriptional regulator
MEDVWKQFEENSLTHSAAHHLLAVMELKRDRGYARVTDVAKHLNITSGSASTNLKSLKTKGLIVEDDNRFLTLSKEGEELARAVVARKEIFQMFLTDVLGVSKEQADVDACKTEHLLSHETSGKLVSFMQLLGKKWGKDPGRWKKSFLNESVDCSSCPYSETGTGQIQDCPVCHDHCLLKEC